MKIKRFQAKNMRDAIRMVREEQGPDAVILSNHRTSDGVEVVAAVDYDAALLQQALRQSATSSAAVAEPVLQNFPAPQPAVAKAAPRLIAPQMPPQMPSLMAPLIAPVAARVSAPVAPVVREPVKPAPQEFAQDVVNSPETFAYALEKSPGKTESKSDSLSQVREELSGIRRLIEPLIPHGMWSDSRRSKPNRMEGLQSLLNLGVDLELAQQVVAELPENITPDRERFMLLALLAKRIPVCKQDVIKDGGIIALVGPTGVGKTTTLAKLAARYIQDHDTRDVALVSTDHYRIGAQEQLFTYGHLLGLPVHTANSAESLSKVLSKLSNHKLVLIDTAGISQRDRKLAQQFLTLSSQSAPIRSYLVMSATSQSSDLDEVVRKFSGIQPSGCILTKLDETTRTGGALSVAIRHQLPIAYTADGQRVPEDLHMARGERLVINAMQLIRPGATPAPEPVQSSRYNGASHAVA